MKKKENSKKYRFWLPLSACLLVLAVTISCQQENDDLPGIERDGVFGLQAWLTKNHPNATFSVDWAGYNETQTGDFAVSRVPVASGLGEYGVNAQAVAEGLDNRYLDYPVWLEVLRSNSREVLTAYIYAVIPSVEYMESRNFSYNDIGLYSLKDFEGNMPMYRLDGAPLQMKVFAEGTLVNDIASAKQNSLDKEGGLFAKRMGSGNNGEWSGCQNYHGEYYPGGYCPACGEDACFWCGKIGCGEVCVKPCSVCGIVGCKDCPSAICEGCGGLKSQCSCIKVCVFCGAAIGNCKCDKSVDPGAGNSGGSTGGTGEGNPANYCGGCMRMLNKCDCEISRCFNCFAPHGTCSCFRDPG